MKVGFASVLGQNFQGILHLKRTYQVYGKLTGIRNRQFSDLHGGKPVSDMIIKSCSQNHT
ncbi:TPA: hypothetical protein MII34_26060 [Klebsiella pneumoniae]|nr:hypothetical protein [Klebsiella pneumoniae]